MRAILTYHSIDGSGSPISLDRKAFERHVAFLMQGSVRVVPLGEIMDADPDEDAVALTFDDGFQNLADVAWPILRDHGLPATVFVVTDRVGRDNAWGDVDDPAVPTLPLMDWETLGRLCEEGLQVGGHSRTHPHLPRLGDERVEDEVAGCLDAIEQRTGRRPTDFAYPYGTVDDATAGCVAKHCERACTTVLAPLPASPARHRLPRIDAFYLKARGKLERFGGASFALMVAWRRLLRSMKARLGKHPGDPATAPML